MGLQEDNSEKFRKHHIPFFDSEESISTGVPIHVPIVQPTMVEQYIADVAEEDRFLILKV